MELREEVKKYPSGLPEESIIFEGRKKQSKTRWYPNGNIKDEIKYVNGKRHVRILWYPNGNIKEEIKYNTKGKEVDVIYRDKQGKIMDVKTSEHDRLIIREIFDDDVHITERYIRENYYKRIPFSITYIDKDEKIVFAKTYQEYPSEYTDEWFKFKSQDLPHIIPFLNREFVTRYRVQNKPAYIKHKNKVDIKKKWYDENGTLTKQEKYNEQDILVELVKIKGDLRYEKRVDLDENLETELYSRYFPEENKWLLDRENAPAYKIKTISGEKVYQAWYTKDKLNRLNGPAVTKRLERNGILKSWYKDGILEYTEENRNGIVTKTWYKDGEIHREGLPAMISQGQGQTVKVYYKYGKEHRLDGPAVISNSGGFTSETYYIDGERINAQDYPEIISRKKMDTSLLEKELKEQIKDKFDYGSKDIYSNILSFLEPKEDQKQVFEEKDGSVVVKYKNIDGYYRTDGPSYIRYYPNGEKAVEKWLYRTDNFYSRKGDKPSYISYYEDGKIREKKWLDSFHSMGLADESSRYNSYHREGDKPSYISYYDNGEIKEEKWMDLGDLHRDNGPAYILRWENGNKKVEKWYIDGENRRDETDIVEISYYPSEKKKMEIWHNVDEAIHRDDGPAITQYFENENKEVEEWYENGLLHREDGPALIEYYESGPVRLESWWFYDEEYRAEEPSSIGYYESGPVKTLVWTDVEDRIGKDEPVRITFYENGVVESKVWGTSKEGRPRKIYYTEEGEVEETSV